MNIEEYRTHCLAKAGTTESFPFSNLPDTLVFKVKGKMFASTNVETFASFSIKCDPNTVDELRAQYPAMREPSYFSKRHWSRVVMDGSIPDHILYEWLDTSYNLVIATLPQKIRTELENKDPD